MNGLTGTSTQGGLDHGVLCQTKFTVPAHCVKRENIFALDIGGSLAKVAYFGETEKDTSENEAVINLASFNTDDIDDCLTFIQNCVLHGQPCPSNVVATGVGSIKYQKKIQQALNTKLSTDANEMMYACHGLNFIWNHLSPADLFYPESQAQDLQLKHFTHISLSGVTPCLLVNLGSAVTIAKVSADGTMDSIVGGSSFGGLSFLGLAALLTKAKSFGDLISLAEKGDHREVDLLVKDTAGSDYHIISADNMVSSFGKPAKDKMQGKEPSYREEDMASSLSFFVTDSMAQTTYLVAKCEQLSTVVFCGSFLTNNRLTMKTINEKLKVASKYFGHIVTPLYVQHEGFLGSLGALTHTHARNYNGNHLTSIR